MQVVASLRLPHAHQITNHVLGLRHREFQIVAVVRFDIVLRDGFDGYIGLAVFTSAPCDHSDEGLPLVGGDGGVVIKIGPSGVEFLIARHLGVSFYIK